MEKTVAKKVLSRIKKKGHGHIWKVESFPSFSPHAVAKALSRFEKRGTLMKVARGAYYYGRSNILGLSKPPSRTVAAKVIGKQFHGGLEAFYNLGLTKQISATTNIVASAQHKIKGIKITRRNIEHLKGATDQEFWLLEALRKIMSISDCPPGIALKKIQQYMAEKRFSIKRLVDLAIRGEPPRVRALLGALIQGLGTEKYLLKRLKRSLNPLTVYKLGLKDELKFSKEWKIE